MARQFLTVVGIAILAAAITAQAPALRIVVLEGENAVNIIQQKTAVRAVVEVRDRNNLPVPGASVTFGITGNGGATVVGPQSVTVTTNAAGQASLTGVSPATSGGLRISVNAASNGLTAAATITQTVVATAAAVAGAAAATGAVAAGGGLSTAAIVGIVGGVGAIGGGAAVLGGGSSGNDQSSTATTPAPTAVTPAPTPLPTCVFEVSPTVLTVPISGGTFGVTVTMSPANCANPAWPVTNVPSFVSVDRTSGTGSGSVTVTVAPFTPTETFPTRTSAISIASTVVNIHQPRPIAGLR